MISIHTGDKWEDFSLWELFTQSTPWDLAPPGMIDNEDCENLEALRADRLRLIHDTERLCKLVPANADKFKSQLKTLLEQIDRDAQRIIHTAAPWLSVWIPKEPKVSGDEKGAKPVAPAQAESSLEQRISEQSATDKAG